MYQTHDISNLHDSRYVAERLGCHVKTVQELARSGEIAAMRWGRTYKFADEWIDDYIESHMNIKKADDGRR